MALLLPALSFRRGSNKRITWDAPRRESSGNPRRGFRSGNAAKPSTSSMRTCRRVMPVIVTAHYRRANSLPVGPHVVLPCAGPKPMLLQWTRTRRTFRVNPSTHRRRWANCNGEGLRTFTMAPL